MAGVLGIYGLIIAVIIANAVSGVEQGRPAYGYLCVAPPVHHHATALTTARTPHTREERAYARRGSYVTAFPSARASALACAPARAHCPHRTPPPAPSAWHVRTARTHASCLVWCALRSSAVSHFGGGIACGLSGLAAGLAIGIVGDSLTRASAEQPKLFVGMVLILIFAEALGLYGLIVGLILASKA